MQALGSLLSLERLMRLRNAARAAGLGYSVPSRLKGLRNCRTFSSPPWKLLELALSGSRGTAFRSIFSAGMPNHSATRLAGDHCHFPRTAAIPNVAALGFSSDQSLGTGQSNVETAVPSQRRISFKIRPDRHSCACPHSISAHLNFNRNGYNGRCCLFASPVKMFYH